MRCALCRYTHGVLIEVNAHSLFSKWFSESGKLVSRLFAKIQVRSRAVPACLQPQPIRLRGLICRSMHACSSAWCPSPAGQRGSCSLKRCCAMCVLRRAALRCAAGGGG